MSQWANRNPANFIKEIPRIVPGSIGSNGFPEKSEQGCCRAGLQLSIRRLGIVDTFRIPCKLGRKDRQYELLRLSLGYFVSIPDNTRLLGECGPEATP